MKHARIRHHGQIFNVQVDEQLRVTLPNGEVLQEREVEWLPPAQGTVFALGLNYADHASELEFKAPEEPLVFLKAPNTLTGHRQVSVRPAGVEYMHYEAELVAVIGKTVRNVSREHAMEYVAGYTLCNDYAIRDYLENYYRPNLRVKSRDTLTPIGPYIVDRDDVADPHRLALSTYVNGELRQRGSTADMIFDIPFLIAYLSEFMTLQPGDMIATGTPKGLADVQPGDEVVVEIGASAVWLTTLSVKRLRGEPAMKTINHWINGKNVASKEYFTTTNPANGEVLEVASGGQLEIDQAVAAAKEAFPKRANTPMKERARLMRRLGELIDQNVPQIAELETADTGLPIHQTKNADPARFAQLRVLRRGVPADERQDLPGRRQDAQLHAGAAGGGVRAGVAVERAVHDRHLENRALPGAGQHRGAEDVRTVAADRRSPGRAGAGGRHSGRGAERGAGLRRHRRRRAGAP